MRKIKIDKNDRVLISKYCTAEYWLVTTNPTTGFIEKAMSTILLNSVNDYVEYKNCGVLHRMIRYKDLKKYGIDVNSVLKEHTLPQLPEDEIT